MFFGQRDEKPCPIISSMKASKSLSQRYIRYWHCAMEAQSKGEKPEDILVICEFGDIFPEELPGLLPQGKIDFEIKLIPSP